MAAVETDQATALVNEPVALIAGLAFIVCVVLAASRLPGLAGLTRVLPAPIWIYLLPMLLASFGVLTNSSPAYDALATLLVPTSLFLLTVSSDFRSTLRIGPLALLILAAGTAGILLGGLLAFVATVDGLPEGSWKGFAVLAGAWIGGSANAIAVQQGLAAAPAIIGPLLIVDTIIGYGWFALLLFMSGQQDWLARVFRSGGRFQQHLDGVAIASIDRAPVDLIGLARVVGAALAASGLATAIGNTLPELGDPTIISGTTWTILIIVALGVAGSFTRLRQLERDGASELGYFLMLMLLASLGARGNFAAFVDAPVYLVGGVIWIGTHALVLGVVARLLRAPPVFFALASVANIGGFVTSPIIAAAYRHGLVPTALIMAAVAQIAGIYLPFLFATLLSSLV